MVWCTKNSLDNKATNRYITHLGNGQLKDTRGYKPTHTNRDRDHDSYSSTRKRDFGLETPGKGGKSYSNSELNENDEDERFRRTQESYKKMKLYDEADRSYDKMALLDMEDLP